MSDVAANPAAWLDKVTDCPECGGPALFTADDKSVVEALTDEEADALIAHGRKVEDYCQRLFDVASDLAYFRLMAYDTRLARILREGIPLLGRNELGERH